MEKSESDSERNAKLGDDGMKKESNYERNIDQNIPFL